MKDHFNRLVLSEKVIVSPASWSAPDGEALKMTWSSPLEIDGVTEEGLFLRGICYQDRPDEAVTLQLEIGQVGLRTRIPLCRLDWRPISPIHNNNKLLATRHSLPRRLAGCHFHPFHMNWDESAEKMLHGNLPAAQALDKKINSFNNLLEFFGEKCKIVGMIHMPEPNWSRKLF